MKKLLMIALAPVCLAVMMALQTKENMATITPHQSIAGEYSLKGVHEMAAGFKLNEDKTFQFFYAYGASDRSAKGTYTFENNKLVLQGTKAAGKDFNLVQQKKSGKGITVSITDKNNLLLQNVVCYFINKTDTMETTTNEQGFANVDMPACTKIQLIHAYFPDIPTTLDITDNQNNFFTFSLNPSLEEVVFHNLLVETDKDTLYVSNIYLFGDHKVSFVKQ